jgi:hypothetical protein
VRPLLRLTRLARHPLHRLAHWLRSHPADWVEWTDRGGETRIGLVCRRCHEVTDLTATRQRQYADRP